MPAPKLWNKLPASLTTASSLISFKSKVYGLYSLSEFYRSSELVTLFIVLVIIRFFFNCKRIDFGPSKIGIEELLIKQIKIKQHVYKRKNIFGT